MQEWKKSSSRCDADVALSLVRVHCKEAKEEKLAVIKAANTKRLDFQYFMETFIEAATRIVIRLQRIYNFRLFHAIILPVLDVYGLY